MPESSFDTTIEREKVEQLAENIRTSTDEVTKILEADEIEIEKLLEVTRFIARSARRISRKAHWTVGEPQPGNERDPKPRRKSDDDRRDDRAPRARSDDRRPHSGEGRGDDRPRRSGPARPGSARGDGPGDRGRRSYND